MKVRHKSIPEVCGSCQLRNSHRVHFRHIYEKSSCAFDIIHVDTWCPFPTNSDNGICCFLLFVDDCTQYQWIYLMHNKSQEASVFRHLEAYREMQFKTKIKQLQSDGGLKFKTLQTYLFQGGYYRRITCPCNPSQNGFVKRKNRHIVEPSLSHLQ